MLNGAAHMTRRVIAGLLVLAMLLMSGAHTAFALRPEAHQQTGQTISQAVAVVIHGVPATAREDDCDDGLLCCISGQCTVHASWVLVQADPLPGLRRIVATCQSDRSRSLAGITTPPASPPPRTAA